LYPFLHIENAVISRKIGKKFALDLMASKPEFILIGKQRGVSKGAEDGRRPPTLLVARLQGVEG
jgi:hypothetical protein